MAIQIHYKRGVERLLTPGKAIAAGDDLIIATSTAFAIQSKRAGTVARYVEPGYEIEFNNGTIRAVDITHKHPLVPYDQFR